MTEVSGELYALAALTLGKKLQQPLNRRLAWTQRWSQLFAKSNNMQNWKYA